MAFENLTDREKQILYNLITFYINTADPVGSRSIANKFKMGISSATIRNTLQDLEEQGLLQQPHTSAGRIPTDLGYRIYVDYLLKPEDLTAKEKEQIKSVLGDITHQLGVSIAPRFEEGILKRLELIPLTNERVMVVVVVKSGLARSVILEIETTITESSLREVEIVLNERLSGLTLGEIRRSITERLADVSGKGRLIKMIVDSKSKIWRDDRSGDIHVWGADYLVKQPEFSDPELISRLMKIIGDNRVLSEFLEASREEGLFITIGSEHHFNEILNCSLVTSPYRVGNISGTIGIIGPTRMPYSKLVSIVQYTAKAITETLSGLNNNKE